MRMKPILNYMWGPLYEKLFGKLLYRQTFYNTIEDIVTDLGEIEYTRMIGMENQKWADEHVNNTKTLLYRYANYLKPGRYSGFKDHKKVVSKCFSEMVYKTMLVENVCDKYKDNFEYKDDLRNLVQKVNRRLQELENMLSDKSMKHIQITKWINRL